MLRILMLVAAVAPATVPAQAPVEGGDAAAVAAQPSDPKTSSTAPAPAAPRTFPIPSPLPPTAALPGDEQLDCGTLYAESKARIRQNGEINEKALAKQYVKGGETKALEVLGQVGGMIPIIGEIISMGSAMGQMASTKKDAERNYGESTRQSDWVMDRMVYVSDMYRNKCLKRSSK